MSMSLEKIIENEWDDIKQIFQNKWSKLTEKDLDEIEGSYDILIGKIKKIYGNNRKDIEKELTKFFLSDEFEEIKSKINNKSEELESGVFALKSTVEKYVKNYLQILKEKSETLEKNVVCYTKQNPFKILLTATLISFALTKIGEFKKNNH